MAYPSTTPNPNPTTPDVHIHFRTGRKRKAYRNPAGDEEAPDIAAAAQAATIPPRTARDTQAPTTAADDASASASQRTLPDSASVKVRKQDGEFEGLTTDASAGGKTRSSDDEKDQAGLNVAQLLRLRNARKSRLGGVAFRAEQWSASAGLRDGGDGDEPALVLHNDGGAGRANTEQKGKAGETVSLAAGIPKRFAPQTGVVGELVNKHMEEYIEAELARRKQQTAVAEAAVPSQGASADSSSSSANPGLAARPDLGPVMTVGKALVPQPAMRGKLLEIDLGDEVAARNALVTELAMRKLQGDTVEAEELENAPRKLRLGRNGKPIQTKNRRGSDDVKRDELIEEFMRENKLDVYDLNAHQAPLDFGEEEGEDMAADDRLADQFRRDFLESMAQRRRRPRVTTKSKTAAPTEEILRGPKLGGSRNVRQQMRDLLLKEQEKRR